ncbi:cytochrome b/b6 domain-containing protein [Anianabacter salinae]|uniref:cytochrome b/b6 domain-containing protein n=1 Tax=Anianabacter salinae TaxID=2851023 RepID=UPI00225E1C77|nr:cytochrome b/b6 domain-containing protein [Anianabacter salinae]MBV0913748.1 cytochrome b/b6 domain-containing protein [Anianabacter salinae]
MTTLDAETRNPKGGDLVKRHRLSTRLWHWINAAMFFILLMSGLMIFNAHPRLYWGEYGANLDPAWLQIGVDDQQAGYLRIGDARIGTDGVLGRWEDADGQLRNRAFPYWATLPSNYNLALARRWHLTFAWVFAVGIFVYLVWSLLNRHVGRDLLPRRDEMRPSHILADLRDHMRLKLPRGIEAARYNILQKLAYLSVALVLIPGMVLTGLTMSPQMDASWPWLLDLFGGRQSARSLHFIFAFLLVLFVIVHLVMVLIAGPFNEIRSMITGWFRLPKERSK